jgi:arginine/lysine/ornithine decarboxylase
MNLYQRLLEYKEAGYYPMHMPGHKRNQDLLRMENPYAIDITEIDGFDNLHHAEGILKESMERCAKLYGSKACHYLIGGSTAGILAGISACTKKGDKILVARNCHKSVYHGMYLRELQPVYIYPPVIPFFGVNGGILPEKIEEMLIKEPDIKCVVITSPTYEGIVSDVKAIAEIAHKFGVPLLVDEAHGAHFGFMKGLPPSSIQQGADVVIHSIHKTLPAFTQTALLHINGELVNYSEIKRYLAIYQTSSPSYVLMSGIEQCVELLETKREELFPKYIAELKLVYERLSECKNIRILTDTIIKQEGFYGFDPSKITLSVKNTTISGMELYQVLLNRYKIQMELVSKDYVLGMTSIADTREGFTRFVEAVLEIDRELTVTKKTEGTKNQLDIASQLPEIVMSCYQAYEGKHRVMVLNDSEGYISAEYLYLYPPGIPLLVPGERITKELLANILEYKSAGLSLQGTEDMKCDQIKVLI